MENQMNNGQGQMGGSNNLMDKASSLLGGVDLSKIQNTWKQYGTTATSKVKNMSTTQKVVGGALLAAGAWYLSQRNKLSYRTNAAHATRHDL